MTFTFGGGMTIGTPEHGTELGGEFVAFASPDVDTTALFADWDTYGANDSEMLPEFVAF